MSLGNINSTFQLTKQQLSSHYKINGLNGEMDGLMNAGWRWGDGSNTDGSALQVINIFFLNSSNPSSNWPSESQEVGVINAMATWEHVANIKFILSDEVADADIVLVNTTSAKIAHYGGWTGTPNQAATEAGVVEAVYDQTTSTNVNVRDSNKGQVYVNLAGQDGSDFTTEGAPTGWNQDSSAWNVIVHELGHALGLKHPHDKGTTNSPKFPGVTGPKDAGPAGLNDVKYTIMSYNKPDPTFKGLSDSPMVLDIAAIQLLYGANTTYNNSDNTYFLPDPTVPLPKSQGGDWGQPGKQWECIWDTGGIDQVVYNGAAKAVIDLRPATLTQFDGGGHFSYTLSASGKYGRGFSIAGDITNAIADVNGVTGVIIENASGGSGDDSIRGNNVANVLHGNGGGDVIYGFDGADTLFGETGRDTLYGGKGDDTYVLQDITGGKYDIVSEANGGGKDTVIVQQISGSGVNSYTLISGIEIGILIATANGFTLTGNDLDNFLQGSDFNDTLVGGLGDDTLNGGHGHDTLKGGFGNDTYVLNYVDPATTSYSSVLEGYRAGTDTVILARDPTSDLASYTLADNVENGKIRDPFDNSGLQLHGNGLNNKLWGGGGNDRVYGGFGNDEIHSIDATLNGHSYLNMPNDLYGEEGNDVYYLDAASLNYNHDTSSNGFSVIHEDENNGKDTVHVMVSFNGSFYVHEYQMTDNVEIGIVDENLALAFADRNFHLIGNGQANELHGSTANDTLDGGGGDDTLEGNDGDDVLDGGSGADTLKGGFGHDLLNGGADGDTYYLYDVTDMRMTTEDPFNFQFDDINENGEDGGTDVVHIRASGVQNFPLGVVTEYALAGYVEVVYVDSSIGMTITGSESGGATMYGNSGKDTLIGGNGENHLYGNGGDDTLTGRNYDDFLIGGGGSDHLDGGGSQDYLTGGAGKDYLSGGNDTDTFIFKSIKDSGVSLTSRDVIEDFVAHSESTVEIAADLIDLSAIDANTHVHGKQAFHFIDTDQFSSKGNHHVYGELRYSFVRGNTFISGDVNGDGKADFQIELAGHHILSGDDFILSPSP